MEHKPECPMNDEQWPKHPLEVCEYCDMISACEQRVANKIAALLVEGIDWQEGRAAGLNAAREAVAALTTDLALSDQDTVVYRADAFAAIDALKEET